MDTVELVWSDALSEVHRFVVGPIANNVYVVRCRRTGEAALLDAANEHDRLLEVARQLGVTSVLETHGHWDHIGAVEAVREAGIDVWVRQEDAHLLPSYDHLLDDDAVHQVGQLRLRTIHTPGHTPGSICFALENTPVLFTGDTLFPGGPGNATFEGGTSRASSPRSTSDSFGSTATTSRSGRGMAHPRLSAPSAAHLDEWVERGW